MAHIVDEVQAIFEQNVVSEFFLQQPQLLLRRAETQQEELKYGMVALLEQATPWTCAEVIALCK